MTRVLGFKDLHDLFILVLSRFSSWFLSAQAEERVARYIGGLVYLILRGQRRMVAGGLAVGLGRELGPDQIRRLTRKVFQNISVESFSLSAVGRKGGFQKVSIDGLENLREALDRRKGVILWENRFGRRLMAKAALIEKGFLICQVHDDTHGGSSTWLGQKLLCRLHRKEERKIFSEVIIIPDDSFAYLRLLVNRLKQNSIVCITAMGPQGHKFVRIEFLGVRYQFATGIVTLARMTGASIVPLFCVTEADDHRVILSKPISLEENGNGDEAVMQGVSRYAALLESYIRRYPDHWHYWHKLAIRHTN
jgi:lauroyl/myristoyl acyltransferase